MGLGAKIKRFIKNTHLAEYYFFCLSLWLSINPKVNFYSQCGEDSLILKYLPENSGTYVDVGAGQPIRGSNTYHFYKKGWTGHLFEPIQSNIDLINIFRRRDKKYQNLVGLSKTKTKFFEFVPTEYSTMVKSVADQLIAEGKKLKSTYEIESIRLSDTDIEISPSQPSFLSIDVEGADLEVLNSIDWTKIRPRVVCIEEVGETNSKLIKEKLELEGYSLVEDSGISKIYLHKNYKS
jgi:FkbM family methyltransferase